MLTFDDVLVIGGGPGGSTVATLCAKAGLKVRLFERQTFPRFQIGESLIPVVNRTLDRLGVLAEMDRLGFPIKHGVQFFSPRGPSRPFYFSEVQDPRLHTTWQVLRSEFDTMLLDHAAAAGVTVHRQTEVLSVREHNGVVNGVVTQDAKGNKRSYQAAVVCDASGQQSMLVRKYGGRKILPGLENASVFTHFENAGRDPGRDAGSTLIYRIDEAAWLWFIPLPTTASVGLVAPASELNRFGATRQEILDRAIGACPPLLERLRPARQSMAPRAARDYSYRSLRDGGRGWLLLGDALGFIDPMYSTGIYLTFHSAELAADAIQRELSASADTAADLAGYSADYQTAFDQFLVLVRAFYSSDVKFGELAKDPVMRQGLVDMLTGLTTTNEATQVTAALAVR